jgi:hypothetical protein
VFEGEFGKVAKQLAVGPHLAQMDVPDRHAGILHLFEMGGGSTWAAAR